MWRDIQAQRQAITELKAEQARLAAAADRKDRALELADADPTLRDAALREAVLPHYEAARQANPGLTATAWLQSDAVTKHPVLSRLVAPAPSAPQQPLGPPGRRAPIPPQQPPPPLERGAGGSDPAPSGAMTAEHIAAAGKDPRAWRSSGARERARAALEARVGVSLAPSVKPPQSGQ